MIRFIKSIFGVEKTQTIAKYKGLSDFLLRAPAKDKKEIIVEAARRANEDQLETLRRAKLKMTN